MLRALSFRLQSYSRYDRPASVRPVMRAAALGSAFVRMNLDTPPTTPKSAPNHLKIEETLAVLPSGPGTRPFAGLARKARVASSSWASRHSAV